MSNPAFNVFAVIALLGAVLVPVPGGSAHAAGAQLHGTTPVAPIYAVKSAQFVIQKSNPPQYVLTAEGIVTTGGWSNGQLIPWIYIRAPADGIYDYDFLATPPSPGTYVTQALSPIAASITLGVLSEEYKGARIHARTNQAVIER